MLRCHLSYYILIFIITFDRKDVTYAYVYVSQYEARPVPLIHTAPSINIVILPSIRTNDKSCKFNFHTYTLQLTIQ